MNKEALFKRVISKLEKSKSNYYEIKAPNKSWEVAIIKLNEEDASKFDRKQDRSGSDFVVGGDRGDFHCSAASYDTKKGLFSFYEPFVYSSMDLSDWSQNDLKDLALEIIGAAVDHLGYDFLEAKKRY